MYFIRPRQDFSLARIAGAVRTLILCDFEGVRLRKLHQMEKYGIVKRTGEYQLRNPGNAAIIWKVA